MQWVEGRYTGYSVSLGGGLITASIEYTTRRDEGETPWKWHTHGYRSRKMFKTSEEAQKSAEAFLKRKMEEIVTQLGGTVTWES